MSRFDYIVTKLNPHGPLPESLGGDPDLTTADVYAALGYGKLSDCAYRIGQALYAPNDQDEALACCHGLRYVDSLFTKNNWSAAKPIQKMLNHDLEYGIAKDRKAHQHYLESKFKFRLVRIAMVELAHNGNCQTCNGTGSVDYRVCRSCKGGRKKPHSQKLKATWLGVDKMSWRNTWSPRYGQIFREFQSWCYEFEQQLKDSCR